MKDYIANMIGYFQVALHENIHELCKEPLKMELMLGIV